MTVLRDDKPGVNAFAKYVRRRVRHLPRRLADSNEDDAPRAERMTSECLFYGGIRKDLREGLLDDAVGIAS